MTSITRLLIGTMLIAWSMSVLPVVAQESEADKAATEAQLEAIQRELEKRQAQKGERQRQLSRTETQLRQLELQISDVATELNTTRNQLSATQSRITELETEQQQLEAQQAEQTKLLEKQVDSAYRSGDNDFLKMILNQDDPALVERMLSYYQYLNKARIDEIETLLATQREIEAVKSKLDDEREQLAEREEKQQRQQGVLQTQMQEQEQLIAKLQRELSSDDQQITKLQRDQSDLEDVLEAIIAALENDVRLDGLSAKKGQLNWPTEGRVNRLFATSRSGSVDWKGVLIEGQSGQPVVSIAPGRVLYANWMRGFGLLLVLDHGDGYMSLYGHNQTILPQVGDNVRTGETIALVGQSGGRSEPALYFELRVRGNAVNPTQWCR